MIHEHVIVAHFATDWPLTADALADLEFAIAAQVSEPDIGYAPIWSRVATVDLAGGTWMALSSHDLAVIVAALDRQRNTWLGPADTWPGDNIRNRMADAHHNLNEGSN
jgi:hypothetical protein